MHGVLVHPRAQRGSRPLGRKMQKYISCRDYERLIKSAKLYSFALRRGCNILFNALEMQKKCEELFPGNENKLFTAYNIIDCDKAREDAKEELDREFKNSTAPTG